MPDAPRCTYVARRFARVETYRLFDDTLTIEGRFRFGNNYAITYRLADLHPVPFRLWVKSRATTIACAVTGLGFASALPPLSGAWLHLSEPALVIAILAGLLIGLSAALFHPFRRERTVFSYTDRKQAFSVIRTQGDPGGYEAFVSQLLATLSKDKA
ncbi:MAG TPA: hypothetical protein VGR00_14595 [Thermoanaerobaculia bacterium]|jgi:hypothetical protein|nr:hypothetical protein [Thermoanaerobaculia bacterium]